MQEHVQVDIAWEYLRMLKNTEEYLQIIASASRYCVIIAEDTEEYSVNTRIILLGMYKKILQENSFLGFNNISEKKTLWMFMSWWYIFYDVFVHENLFSL